MVVLWGEGERGGRPAVPAGGMIRTATPARPAAPRHLPNPNSPFALALGPALGERRPATVVGVEHEYSLGMAGDRLDFRTLIHELDIAGRRLDPGDANAYRCPSGLVVTCDAEDAEVVSPPLAVQPGFAAEVETWADHGWAELRRLLPPGITVTPFSTHVSASMPDELVDGVGELFARTFAPALMLMLDRADSHGVFVRPRPGRLELCGEHATGPRLGAAAVLVAGGARACAASGPLPPVLAVDVRPATGRHGLFVGRNLAFGYDLYAGGRRAVLPLQSGGATSAQAHLVAAWEAARGALGDDVGAADLAAGDAMVSGSMPLGIEERDADEGVPPPWPPAMPTSPFGDVVEPRARSEFDVTPVAATWDFTVFRLDRMARQTYACVPGSHLGTFLERLDAGSLDDIVIAFLDGRPTGSVLFAHDQTGVAGLWDRAVIGPDLLPYERPAAVVAGPIIDVPAPASYVRRGKAAVVLPTPAAITYQPIFAVGEPPAVPPSEPPTAPARSPAPLPPLRRGHRRRPARVAVLAVLTLFVAGGAAALAGVFGNGEPTGVAIVSGAPAPSPSNGVAPLATGPTSSPPPLETTAVAPESPSTSEPANPLTVPDTDAVAPAAPTTIRSTPVVTGPATTLTTPVETTVAVDTTVPPDTTTITTAAPTTTTTPTTTPPPTSFVVAVTSGILGCSFQPASASAVAGSTVRFRNDTSGSVSLSFASPVADATTVSLDSGGSAGPFALATPGSYGVTCNSGAGSTIGRLAITVTNA